MGFVDDDDVPVALVRPNPELGVLFQGVDGNNGLVEVMEGVRVGRDSAADAFEPDGVEAHQRYRETRPEFLLELRHHALGGDHQDSLALAAIDQFAEQDAHLDGLAKANGVGHQNTLPRLFERQQRGIELVRQVVDGRAVADPQVIAGWR